MGPDAGGAGGPGVVADEDRGREARVDALHHPQRPRPRADDRHVRRQLIDEHVLAVSMGVADHDFRGAGIPRPLDRGIQLVGHELARSLILESRGAELLG